MKALLIDLDGVLRIGKSPAEGIAGFLNTISEIKIPACIISNSTLSSSVDIRKFFDANKINCSVPIMTAADASLDYVRSRYKRVSVYCSEPVKSLFREIDFDKNPEAVLVGDMGKKWDFNILNNIFKKVFNGADLIAMQKNRFWKTPEDGYLLDAGPFVTAIEYAVNKEAVLIGKPSPIYFKSALRTLGLDENSEFVMLGDDIETDITGARNIGGKTILIYTGKTKYPLPENSPVKPDYEAADLKEVISILKQIF